MDMCLMMDKVFQAVWLTPMVHSKAVFSSSRLNRTTIPVKHSCHFCKNWFRAGNDLGDREAIESKPQTPRDHQVVLGLVLE